MEPGGRNPDCFTLYGRSSYCQDNHKNSSVRRSTIGVKTSRSNRYLRILCKRIGAIRGSEGAADSLRAPFVLGDRRELEVLFRDAGVGSVEMATHRGTAQYPSIHSMVEADLRGWLPVMGVMLPEEQIKRILGEAERDLSPYVSEQVPAMFDLSAHIVTGAK